MNFANKVLLNFQQNRSMGAGAFHGCPPRADSDSESLTSSQSPSSAYRDMDETCHSCTRKFHFVTRRRRTCGGCAQFFCSACLLEVAERTGKERRCASCRVLFSSDLRHADLMSLRVKDLRRYLADRNIPDRTCTEKNDLVELILQCAAGSAAGPQSWYHTSQATGLRTGQYEPSSVPHCYQSSFRADGQQNCQAPQPEQPVEQHVEENTERRTEEQMEHHAEEQAEQHTEEQTEEHISERTREHTDGHTEEQVEQQTEGQTERHTEGQTESQEAGVASQSSTREPVASSESSSEVPHNTDQRSVDAQFQGLTKKCLTLDDILVYDEIAALTIRQLKEILFTNFVDYKGCCEKQELLDKVHRLYREHCENKVKAEAADDVTATGSPAGGASEEEFMCKVCMDAVVDCVLLECGHMLTCTSCGKRLSECPICRQYVTRVVHVFRS